MEKKNIKFVIGILLFVVLYASFIIGAKIGGMPKYYNILLVIGLILLSAWPYMWPEEKPDLKTGAIWQITTLVILAVDVVLAIQVGHLFPKNDVTKWLCLITGAGLAHFIAKTKLPRPKKQKNKYLRKRF